MGLFIVFRRRHRRFLFVAFMLFLFLCFFSLGPKRSSTLARGLPQTGATSTPQATPTPQVTLTWFMHWDQSLVKNVALPLIVSFGAQAPNIKVDLENIPKRSEYERKLQARLESNQAPDVVYLSTLAAHDLALHGRLLSLNDLIAADNLDLAAYDPTVLALHQIDNQLYCLPLDVAAQAVFYNQDIFAAANIPVPQDGWTWDDFLQTALALTADHEGEDHDIFGVDLPFDQWPLLVWAWAGHNVFDDPDQPQKFLLNDEASVAALQWLADLQNEYHLLPDEDARDREDDLFLAGRAAMTVAGLDRLPAYLHKAEFPFDFAPLPVGQFAVNRADGGCFAIAANSQQPAAAWQFVKFLAGPQGRGAALLTELQQITPALLPLQQSDSFLKPFVLPGANKAAFLAGQDRRFALYDPLHPLYQRWEDRWQNELEELWAGDVTAQEAVAQLAEEAEELLADLAPTRERAARVSTAITETLATLPTHYYVAPNGSDEQSGLDSGKPLATVQRALALVKPGDTIHLAPGDYYEQLTSLYDGSPEAPITIIGPPDAVLHGADGSNIAFLLTNDYYTLVGFSFDGLRGQQSDEGGYTEILLYLQGRTVRKGVTGVRVLNVNFRNAGGECMRLRYFAQKNEIAYSHFETCGLFDFVFEKGGKNGEAIYIGTSSNQWDDGKNPTDDPDESSDNWVHHNFMNTGGNECVEIKEGAHSNLVEYNTCTGQRDPESAGLGARGDNNIFRYNVVYNNVGAGVRLGGHEVNGVRYGVNNEVYGNQLFGNVAGGVNIAVGPQTKICDNLLQNNLGAATLGDEEDAYNPAAPC